MIQTVLAIGSILFGIGGVLLHLPAARLALVLGINANTILPLVGTALFALLLLAGGAMAAGAAWGASLARKLAVGLILISALDAAGAYLGTTTVQPGAEALGAWLVVGAHLVAGIVWPIVLVAVLSRPAAAPPTAVAAAA
jgi:hypothetical protein